MVGGTGVSITLGIVAFETVLVAVAEFLLLIDQGIKRSKPGGVAIPRNYDVAVVQELVQRRRSQIHNSHAIESS
jgi:hypothetical protein